MPNDHKKSKEEEFKDYVRNYLRALEFAVGNLQFNVIAMKNLAGLTDEQMDKELTRLREQKEQMDEEAAARAAELNKQVEGLAVKEEAK